VDRFVRDWPQSFVLTRVPIVDRNTPRPADASRQGNAVQRALDLVQCLRMWREQTLQCG